MLAATKRESAATRDPGPWAGDTNTGEPYVVATGLRRT